MSGEYYDIEDILATDEKIPCKFNLSVPGLGYLEGNPGKAIQKDAKIDLPLWLAEALATTSIAGEAFVDLSQPDAFGATVLNAIKADSVSLDLHGISTSYYKLAEKWCAMYNDEELSDIIMTMLKERSYEINNYAGNANKQINNNFIYSLDEFEKKLFKLTSENNKQFRNWLKE